MSRLRTIISLRRAIVSALLLCLCAPAPTAQAQDESRPLEKTADEIVRINTELVQTDVMVFDQRGRFVDGLTPEQFELRVDDQPVPIAFFERIIAGSAIEAVQRNAPGSNNPNVSKQSLPGKKSFRGRTIIFFIDDLHLSLDSLGRTRTALSNFIEREMGAKDQAAIASASGQIGFLQQLTDNKAVLRAALARLRHLSYRVQDTEQPTMSEYMALKIEQRDRDAQGFYIDRCLHDNRLYTPTKCAEVVHDRARVVIQQASAVTANTLYSLESLMRSSAQVKGRKLVMLISDGFFLGAMHRYANAFDKLPQITDEARRHGVVIYTIDARGLISGQADATTNLVDGNGVLDRANLGEIPASQDALHALAVDTGGRALRNSNSITGWVTDTLKETSDYYLLAWRPVNAEQRTDKFKRVTVRVLGHPELTVRLPRGYLETERPAAVANAKDSKNAPKPEVVEQSIPPAMADLRSALVATYPQQALATLLNVTFLDTPNNGLVLTASTQISTHHLTYGMDGRAAAVVDLAGVILNSEGKLAASFRTKLSVDSPSEKRLEADDAGVIYNHRAPLAPGLYQVRVAARDERSRRTGSAMQWIEIPDLKAQGLSLSSLLTGVQAVDETQKANANLGALPQVQFSVDNHFKRSSRLGFLIFIYNAAKRAAGESAALDLTGKVQVFNNQGQAVLDVPARKLLTDATTDPARIPYAGSFPLQALAPDEYVLRVTVTNRASGTTAQRQLNFTVE